MSRHSAAAPDRASTLSFWLLVAFLAILWLAGGASRADVLGQSVVRFSAWAIGVAALLALPRLDWRAIRGPATILGAAVLLVALQLVPLPAAIWTELPGRSMLTEAAALKGTEQPWRPLSISPSGTTNALSSLIVPAAVLLLAANLSRSQHWRIALFVIGLVGTSAILGVMQFSGANFDNPLINTVPGAVAGNFANRNHFALFIAFGCALSLAWTLRSDFKRWKVAVTFGLLAIFLLTVLASGSRSGMLLFIIAIALAGLAAHDRAAQQLKYWPRKIAWLLVLLGLGIFTGLVVLSISFNRAASIERVSKLQSDADLRWQIWPVIWDMLERYFPIGSGFGTFDQAFRINEPDTLLQQQYINLAHNDWLQISLEGGLPGLIILISGVCWFLLKVIQVWRANVVSTAPSTSLAKAGGVIMVLVFVASITDYAIRTPMVMAVVALAATWLESIEARDIVRLSIARGPSTQNRNS